jgi:hypothetical protein
VSASSMYFSILESGGLRHRVGRVWSGPAGSESEGLRSGSGLEAGDEAGWWHAFPRLRRGRERHLRGGLSEALPWIVSHPLLLARFSSSLFFSLLPYQSLANPHLPAARSASVS